MSITYIYRISNTFVSAKGGYATAWKPAFYHLGRGSARWSKGAGGDGRMEMQYAEGFHVVSLESDEDWEKYKGSIENRP